MLTLRDYLLEEDISTLNGPNISHTWPAEVVAAPDASGNQVVLPSVAPAENMSNKSFKADEHWALKYINVANVRPIIEAMDEDGSGFISVYEANKFALSRPQNIR